MIRYSITPLSGLFRLFAFALTVLLCLSVHGEAKDLRGHSNLQRVRELYENVRNTLPSEVNAEQNTQAIRSRLACYEENHEYGQRIRICNNKYAKNIVQSARKTIRSRPSLGEFVVNVNMCPILYNICMGKTEGNTERCILFERQCIDYTLDIFWRGSAQYGKQTYRLDR